MKKEAVSLETALCKEHSSYQLELFDLCNVSKNVLPLKLRIFRAVPLEAHPRAEHVRTDFERRPMLEPRARKRGIASPADAWFRFITRKDHLLSVPEYIIFLTPGKSKLSTF